MFADPNDAQWSKPSAEWLRMIDEEPGGLMACSPERLARAAEAGTSVLQTVIDDLQATKDPLKSSIENVIQEMRAEAAHYGRLWRQVYCYEPGRTSDSMIASGKEEVLEKYADQLESVLRAKPNG